MLTYEGNAVADTSGAATITFTPRANRVCTVRQVSVAMRQAPGAATCELQLNGRYLTTLVAQGDTADGEPPVPVQPNDQLVVVWAGATAGNPAEATFLYEYA